MSDHLRLKVAKVFRPLWMSDTRYLGAKGGRGSGKSHDRATNLLIRMIDEPDTDVACIREIQGTLAESVHKLLADKIHGLGMGAEFQVLENEIRRIGGRGKIIFKGMKDQNADSIKSMEGVDIAWWEEAQTASSRSLQLLRPTIRKPGSQVWFTWNPRFKSDPVDVFFNHTLADEEKTLVTANWYDNPWFTDELEAERQIDLRGDRDTYEHVWEGAYQAASDMQFIQDREVRAAMEREVYTDLSDVLIMGVDVARYGDDSTRIVFRRGMDASSMPSIEMNKADTMTVAGKVKELSDRHGVDAVFIDETGVGAGVVDRCLQLQMDNVIGVNYSSKADRDVPGLEKCANKRAEMWALMRMAIRQGLQLPKSERLQADLTGPLYKFDVHNAILLEKKEDMKKRGLRSPDEADALGLTFAYPVTARRVMAQFERDRRNAEPYNPWG